MELGRVLVVFGFLLLVVSLFVSWFCIVLGDIRGCFSLREADELMRLVERAYGGNIGIHGVSPFAGMAVYIVIMMIFVLIGLLDRVLAFYNGFLIFVFSLVIYDRALVFIADGFAEVIKGFVEFSIGYYSFFAAGLSSMAGGLAGWKVRVKSKSDALEWALIVWVISLFPTGITMLGISLLYMLDRAGLFLIILLSAVMTIIVAMVDYIYRRSLAEAVDM